MSSDSKSLAARWAAGEEFVKRCIDTPANASVHSENEGSEEKKNEGSEEKEAFDAQISAVRGLVNINHNCFFNSVLQSLIGCVPLEGLWRALYTAPRDELRRALPKTFLLVESMQLMSGAQWASASVKRKPLPSSSSSFSSAAPPGHGNGDSSSSSIAPPAHALSKSAKRRLRQAQARAQKQQGGGRAPQQQKQRSAPSPSPSSSSSSSSSVAVAVADGKSTTSSSVTFFKQHPDPCALDVWQWCLKDFQQVAGRMEDAHEWMQYLIDALHSECVDMAQLVGGREEDAKEKSFTRTSDALGDDGGWEEVGRKNKASVITQKLDFVRSPISDIFGGVMKSVIHAHGIKDSVSSQPFFSVSLDIEKRHVRSLDDALRQSLKRELEGYKAQSGKNTRREKGYRDTVEATQTEFFEKLPPCLTLTLNRFKSEFDAHGRASTKKIMKRVVYGMDLCIDRKHIAASASVARKDLEYELNAVIFHHGINAENGHYTCCVKRKVVNQENDCTGFKWLHFDDKKVNAISEKDLLEKDHAYILLYKQNKSLVI
jgi:ubiquitin C-terminal hydrolase